MLRKAAAYMLVCALASSGAQAADLPRIASTSLCGDAYLLALAPERAAALSWQSRDPVSLANEAERQLPQVWDNPERLIGSGADHILFGPGEGQASTRFLAKAFVSSNALIWGEDFDSVLNNYAAFGTAIHAETIAVNKAKDISRRLKALKRRAESRAVTSKILYISRAGGTAGPGTFVDAAITATGGRNIIEEPGWLTLDIEFILSLDPDMIVTSFMETGYESVNANGLRHKIFREFLEARPAVDIPGKLWPCAGPGLIEAAELIADGLDRLK